MAKISNFMRASMVYLFPIAALILSLYAKETSAAARRALYLCLDVVIPSLFPFFILSKIAVPYLSSFSCPRFLKCLTEKFFGLPYYTLITIILGFLSGYPTGAKLARDMFDDGLLDSRQASKIIAVANNCSPLFVIGTVGAGLFKSIKIGIFLLMIHWLSGFIAAIITGRSAGIEKGDNQELRGQISKKKTTAGIACSIPSAIEESALLCIKVSGYIVLFAVLSELMSQLGIFSLISGIASFFNSSNTADSSFRKFTAALLKGFMEIASGSQAISQLNDATINMKLAAISFICGFAGFSVHMQVMGIMKGTNAKYRVFFSGKLLHGIIAGLITFLVTSLYPMSVQTSSISPVTFFDFSGIRIITIGVILFSLMISPPKKHLKKASMY